MSWWDRAVGRILGFWTKQEGLLPWLAALWLLTIPSLIQIHGSLEQPLAWDEGREAADHLAASCLPWVGVCCLRLLPAGLLGWRRAKPLLEDAKAARGWLQAWGFSLMPGAGALMATLVFFLVKFLGILVFGGYHRNRLLHGFANALLTVVMLGSTIGFLTVPLSLCCAAGGTVALVRRFGWAEVRGLVALLWAVGALGVIVLGWGSSGLVFLLGSLAPVPFD
jgi:hypothetical protein